MCGIAGIIEHGQPSCELVKSLERMRSALRHRGPDDEDIFLSANLERPRPAPPTARCGLAHTRLSILDLSPAGHQPMSTPDGRYWITYNGEIYNFVALRQELEQEGVRFQSHSDTEVILRLYQRDGPDCVQRLAGMFAFAIWDAQEERCFLARDPLGIKPLYYFLDGPRLVFASELRAVLASNLTSREACPTSLYLYFLTGSVPAPWSMVRGVHVLKAGSWLVWEKGGVRKQSYWRMQFGSGGTGALSPAQLTRSALLDSLERHFVSDVPVGLFLSGGMDSTALLALARQLDHPELETFCISFDNHRLNEGEIARRTAEHFGATHHDWRLDAKTGGALLADFLSKVDRPTIDGFNTFCVSKHAHDHGIKAVLSGLGGDEVFGGYSSFQDVPRLYRWSRALNPVAPLRAAAGRGLERWASTASFRRLGSYLQENPSMPAAYQAYRGIFTTGEAARLTRHFLGRETDGIRQVLPEEPEADDPTLEDEVCRLEIENYMRFQLLRDSDSMSMAWGLELRTPYVDRPFIEAMTAIPARERLAPGKRLLLQAVPEIPAWVAQRPKQGFIFPFEEWLSGEWEAAFQSIGDGTGVFVQTWYQKWSLFVLTHWCAAVGIGLPGHAE